ncbi:PAS domain-containing protein [Mesorhizobium caraganae]|uniref:PAS domain-containing protein n=1 Tax=Mesorhizobium caraganae TaxID=483206 RepID=UPI001FEFFB00|nr:PAS domain-containing protein [Mesorhizobium caraganae]
MNPELSRYFLICDAIALLFQPYSEVVLHNLSTETVAHIAGTFSNREVGKPSLLSEVGFKEGAALIGHTKRPVVHHLFADGSYRKRLTKALADLGTRTIEIIKRSDMTLSYGKQQFMSQRGGI